MRLIDTVFLASRKPVREVRKDGSDIHTAIMIIVGTNDVPGKGNLTTIENDFMRYVGAQICIGNPQGTKVGKVSHRTKKENVYFVCRECLAERLTPMQAAPAEQVGLFA